MRKILPPQGLKVSANDRRRYVFEDRRDYLILQKIYKLEKKHLSHEDRKLVKFLRTQLEDDWRSPLLKKLDGLLRRYKA